MGYSAKAVANYFLVKYGKAGISPLKIQKLVYIAHGWYMAYHEEPLIGDEYAEAWTYGPVFSSLYHEFKHRGHMPILKLATELDVSSSDVKTTTPSISEEDNRTRMLLDKIWTVYGGFSGMKLSAMCHQHDSPWSKTKTRKGRKLNANIPDEDIREYYKERLERNKKNRIESRDKKL